MLTTTPRTLAYVPPTRILPPSFRTGVSFLVKNVDSMRGRVFVREVNCFARTQRFVFPLFFFFNPAGTYLQQSW